ncbi:MAG: ABC transporter permease [Caldilinea sp.]|nr:ABC transporter permease [Caldilinea sp.]MCB0058212.1 ABC transporter permease [Caldilineaceae bacterium]MCB0048720.1 ABC transporter permease [Caldilinea sp.]MCB0150716.1 ABC transporter permease [Caldilineaceae bacterium]MCB9116879.1 ABC transporter permease [Caldilineaceae bacterium]
MAVKASAETQSKSQTWERINGFLNKYGIVIILLAMFIAFSLLSEGFFTTRNIFNIIRQISFMGLIAIGVTMVIITGGIDLGSGSVLALAAVVATSLAQIQTSATLKYPGLIVPVIVPIGAALAIGALTGVINGSLIAKFKIPPFIATLGMMTVARGFALIYSNKPLSQLTPEYNFIGQGEIFGVPFPVIILITVAILAHIMLNNVPFGRYIYALGGNEQAARISGVNIDRVKIGVYTIAGLLSGLAGLVVSSRVGSGQPGQGVGIELDAIAAAVIGGTSLSGGIGTIWGTIVGALIIGVLDNGLILLNVDQYWITIVKGSIIVVAVIIDQRKNR